MRLNDSRDSEHLSRKLIMAQYASTVWRKIMPACHGNLHDVSCCFDARAIAIMTDILIMKIVGGIISTFLHADENGASSRGIIYRRVDVIFSIDGAEYLLL